MTSNLIPPQLTYCSLIYAVAPLYTLIDAKHIESQVSPEVMWKLSDAKVKSQFKMRALRRIFPLHI